MQWLKGNLSWNYLETEHGTFADHSMNDYYNLCKQQLAEENASN